MLCETTLRPIYNYPTVPETSPRHQHAAVPPVTRRDLGTDFRAYMQFLTCDWRTSGIYDVIQQVDLASVTMFRWYGSVEVPEGRTNLALAGQVIPGWEEAARQHAARGGYIYFNSHVYSRISKAEFEKVKAIFGQRFIGFNEGEWDGAYVNLVSSGTIPLSPSRFREEALAHYLEWMGKAYADHHNRMFTMTSIGMGCHYGGELGTRMMAAELSQALPSNTVLMAFCRGAGKQYDLLLHTVPSVFSSRGVPGTSGLQCYPAHGQPPSIALGGGLLAGPEHGASRGLLKRLWWLSYMSGASITGFESGYFPCDATGEYEAQGAVDLKASSRPGDVFAHLTPLGWIHWEALQACRRHPVRGVPYIPVAVMLPVAHGWYPQGYYSEREHCVWGNIPYNAGDWQIDKFFHWVYPGYRLAHHVPCCDERGVITNTPFGDSFDVILANASDACLAKYQAVILLGAMEVAGDPALAARLKRFVEQGGTVVTDAAAWTQAVLPGAGAASADAAPVTVHAVGKGRLVSVLPAALAADDRDGSRFDAVTAALAGILRSFELIELEGRPLYYLVNVTDRPDELIVTLCNNSHALPWEGVVRVKGQTIVDMEEWVGYGEADLHEGGLRCGVPANDVRVFRVRTRQAFLPLAFKNIPWGDLGVAVPEGANE